MSRRPTIFPASKAGEAAEPPMAAKPNEQPAAPASKYAVAKTREGKRNATVYLEPEALRQLKLIAVKEEATVQGLLIEAINDLFAKRGMSRIA